MKFRRTFLLSNIVKIPAGIQAELLTSTHESLSVFLDWDTGGGDLLKLLKDQDGAISVTFGRVPKVTGSCEIV